MPCIFYVLHITLFYIMHHISMLRIFINKIKVKENLRDDKNRLVSICANTL